MCDYLLSIEGRAEMMGGDSDRRKAFQGGDAALDRLAWARAIQQLPQWPSVWTAAAGLEGIPGRSSRATADFARLSIRHQFASSICYSC